MYSYSPHGMFYVREKGQIFLRKLCIYIHLHSLFHLRTLLRELNNISFQPNTPCSHWNFL